MSIVTCESKDPSVKLTEGLVRLVLFMHKYHPDIAMDVRYAVTALDRSRWNVLEFLTRVYGLTGWIPQDHFLELMADGLKAVQTQFFARVSDSLPSLLY